MVDIIEDLTSVASFTIAVFGVLMCLMQRHSSTVRLSFAAFLAAMAINNAPGVFRGVIGAQPDHIVGLIEVATWPSSALLAPFFWIYVYMLTSSDEQLPKRLAWHCVLPGLTILAALCIVASPASVQAIFASENPEVPLGWPMALVMLFSVLQLALYPQMAFYIYLIIRRLIAFQPKLRDVYASTEQHELRWIYVIGGLCVLFWLVQALMLVFAFDATASSDGLFIVGSLGGLALVTATVLWGARQQPPLTPDDGPPTPPQATPKRPNPKYEKSALSIEASQRLGRKLHAAMEREKLYRNADLSLWILARHIGSTPNYISQTLNDEIGQSFFDFVNGYRVGEAKLLLASTNKSVLEITYEVGFNARSSFYNAFKRVSGETPSKYRKNMSGPDGLDDLGQSNGQHLTCSN